MTQAASNGVKTPGERLTPDLLLLRERVPRDAWEALPTDSLSRTWLAMHDSLRHGQETLERLAMHWQLKLIDVATFRDRALPLLRQHLGHLHGHHRLEDTHYFPQFRTIEPRLVKGFDLLQSDHADLDASISALEAMTGQLASLDKDGPEVSSLSQRIAEALHRLGPPLRAHLLDEEDLVIPLVAIAQGHVPAPNPT